MDPIDGLFARLDAWRHLPSYQLERRADALFALYLPEVIAERVGQPLDPVVIPELPLRRAGDHRSKKVDYALFAADRSRAYLVELKTDVGSRRDAQDRYLDHAARRGMRDVALGICQLVRATAHRRKYFHLVARLAAVGLVEVPAGLEDALFGRGTAPPDALLAQLRPTPLDVPIEVIFVQPRADARRTCVDFAQFAAHVERGGDPFGRRFAESLRRWIEPAGDAPP
jgi:hypothetical protein